MKHLMLILLLTFSSFTFASTGLDIEMTLGPNYSERLISGKVKGFYNSTNPNIFCNSIYKEPKTFIRSFEGNVENGAFTATIPEAIKKCGSELTDVVGLELTFDNTDHIFDEDRIFYTTDRGFYFNSKIVKVIMYVSVKQVNAEVPTKILADCRSDLMSKTRKKGILRLWKCDGIEGSRELRGLFIHPVLYNDKVKLHFEYE